MYFSRIQSTASERVNGGKRVTHFDHAMITARLFMRYKKVIRAHVAGPIADSTSVRLQGAR